MKRTYSPPILACLLFGLCLSTCTRQEDPCIEQAIQKIKIKEGEAGLSTERLSTVLSLVLLASDDDEVLRNICTATHIAPDVALTARHCVSEVAASNLFLRTASEQKRMQDAAYLDDGCLSLDAPAAIQVSAFVVHPELDLALLFFDGAENQASALINREELSTGDAVILTGFGLTEDATKGDLRAIEGTIEELEEEAIIVQGIQGGACLGDSGGPLLSIDESPLTVLGVLIRGSASCWARDEYVPIALAANWIEQHVMLKR